MSTSPAVHQRRSIRLKGYDYAQAGAYFITICTHNRKQRFGEIVRAGFTPAQNYQPEQPQGLPPRDANGAGFTPDQNAKMQLNEYGQIAQDQWLQIPARFENIESGAFIIMPNHIHGILVIHDPEDETTNIGVGVGANIGVPTGQPQIGQPQGLSVQLVQLGNIVGAYKSLVANECLEIYKTKNETMGKLWQRNYYEHIIRDEKSYLEIAQYIFNNPAKWALDSLFPEGTP